MVCSNEAGLMIIGGPGYGRGAGEGGAGGHMGGAASGKFESLRFSGQIGQEVWKVVFGLIAVLNRKLLSCIFQGCH